MQVQCRPLDLRCFELAIDTPIIHDCTWKRSLQFWLFFLRFFVYYLAARAKQADVQRDKRTDR